MKKTILSWLLMSSSILAFAQIDTTKQTTDTTKADTSNLNNPTNVTSNADTTSVNMNTSTSSNAYNAYGTTSVAIPSRAQMNFSKDYPAVASSNITWTKAGEWYHGTYLNNGRYSHIYYDDRGNTWTVAMPVVQSYVPDDIVNKATTMFGPMIYDVTTLKGDSTHATIYQIRTIENGQVKAQWIADDGSAVMDPFRSDVEVTESTSTNPAMDSNVNTADSTSANTNVNTTVTTDANVADSTSSMDTKAVTDTSDMKNTEGVKMKVKTETSDGKETKMKIKDGKVKKDD